MLDTFGAVNEVDDKGNPTGGTVTGTGLNIVWQNGPLGRGPNRKPANGAFVETCLAAVKQRIEHYQTASGGKFACPENAMAIGFIACALAILDKRTKDREARQVEGTHQA